jgi:hypothetical protein
MQYAFLLAMDAMQRLVHISSAEAKIKIKAWIEMIKGVIQTSFVEKAWLKEAWIKRREIKVKGVIRNLKARPKHQNIKKAGLKIKGAVKKKIGAVQKYYPQYLLFRLM